jgi:hypothetical protein
METVIAKLSENIEKYFHNSNESVILTEILMGIVVLQYTFRIEPISIIEIIISIVSGLYFADLKSGLTHMYFDTYDGNGETRIQFASEFLHHHENPSDVIDDTTEINLRRSSIPIIPFMYILYNLTPMTSKSQILFQISSEFGTHLMFQTHKYAHLTNILTEEQKQKPEYKLMMFLQDIHLILHPNEHRPHHTSEKHDVNYCILNGWANPLLNSIVHTRLFP